MVEGEWHIYLGPRRVEVSVGKDMDSRRDLRHELITVAWPVGNVNHGLGEDISDHQVEAVVQSNFLLYLLRKLSRTLLALLSSAKTILKLP